MTPRPGARVVRAVADPQDTFLETFTDAEREHLAPLRFAVCVGRFYEDLATRLIDGALAGYEIGGVGSGSIDVHSVPGAFELPFAAKLCADTGSISGVACLGVVIRGETDHFDFVCAESARGLQDVQLATGVPCAFGVITCDTMEQALARAGGGKRDQGRAAALTVMRMALMRRQLT